MPPTRQEPGLEEAEELEQSEVVEAEEEAV